MNLPTVKKLCIDKMKGVYLDHPIYDMSLLQHSFGMLKWMENHNCSDGDKRLAILHDVGKVLVQRKDPGSGHDCYLGHANATIMWADSVGIDLSDMDRDIILVHGKMRSWNKTNKRHLPYVKKHGIGFLIRATLLLRANIKFKRGALRQDKKALYFLEHECPREMLPMVIYDNELRRKARQRKAEKTKRRNERVHSRLFKKLNYSIVE